MKEKKCNPMSCFDDEIGDDFLGAWKPSNISSVSNLDFDCSQLNASEKTFKLPENFDLDMPDFGTGLNNKLSSFDIDLEFLKSPKHGDSTKENRGEALTTLSQTSSDALQASSGHVASSLPGREREDVARSEHGEENSSFKGHGQVDANITYKAVYSREAWGSQTELMKTPVDFSEDTVLEETGEDTMKGTTHDSSFSESFEGTIQLDFSQELLDTVRETCEQPRKGGIGQKNVSTLRTKDKQEQSLLPAQGVSKEKNSVAGVIVSDKNAEEVTVKQIETEVERRSFQEMLQGVTKEQNLVLPSDAEAVTPKHTETKSERSSLRETVLGATKDQQSQELQIAGLALDLEDDKMQTDLQPHCFKDLRNSFAMVIKNNKEQTRQTDTEPWKADVADGRVTKTSVAENTQKRKTSLILAKDLNKADVLNSSSPQGAKLKSTAPKHSLSKAFLSLKPTQVSALRTSRSHALQPLRFEKQVGDPAFKADDDELLYNLKPQVKAEIEAPEKRLKLQAAHRTEQESFELKLLNAGEGNMTKMAIPAVEKLNVFKQIPHAASHSQSRPPSSSSRLTSLTRLQQKHSGSTSAARIELPRPEDIFVVTNSLYVESSLSHSQAVDPATAEIVKEAASGVNHKSESIYQDLKKPKSLAMSVSHSLHKKTRVSLTESAMIDEVEDVENIGLHNFDEKPSFKSPLTELRGGCADSEMHQEAECNQANTEVACHHLLLEDIVQGQTCAKEITRDSKHISKTTAYYSVELDEIMSVLKQKQRRANDLLAEAMAHNAKMKYLLDSKNQEKIMRLQKSIAERLEGVKLQAVRNRAKTCEWCEEHREDETAAFIKERCGSD
ncbi:hypothetical protein M758_UG340300 [Ceratodon purpureus]|nr:hypothetical protein M758_UG340300 [Ceratodon purpureus]